MAEAAAETAETTEESATDISKVAADLAAMRQGLDAERETRARLEGQIQELRSASQPKGEPQKTYSRAELQAAVDAGTITEEAKEAYLDKQREEKIRAELRKEIDAAKRDIQTEAQVAAEIETYTKAIPTIMEKGHEDRARVQTEYDKLIRMGMPETNATQLLAVKAAFGPPPTKFSDKPEARETEQSGAGGGSAPTKADTDGPLAGLEIPSRNRAYYEKLVSQGTMTWDNVKDEWSKYQKARA